MTITDRDLRTSRFTRSTGAIRWLTALSMCVALGMLALGAAVLLDARNDAWRMAEQASDNLAMALARNIGRNVELYDLSLQGVTDALQQPGLDQVSPTIRHMTLFDRAASAEFLGSILVLDPAGSVIADSTSAVPHQLNLADRDYFQVHREQPDLGLFISRPYRSRLRGGDASISISRRLQGADGQFEGVVAGAMRLAYFQDLFAKLDLGARGAVSLFRTDGRMIARFPSGAENLGRDLSGTDTFRRFAAASSGHFTGTAAIDGVERLYSFRRIGGLPMIVSVGLATDEIFAAWRQKALAIGSVLVLLCGATLVLCALLRGELLRRVAAERELVETAEELMIVATTDGLTGLNNRRAFEQKLSQEWRRAARNELPVALLMLDADCFKAYNDHYGHQDGDLVLQSIASCIQQNIRRPADLGARYGGEEFSAILPETDLEGAHFIAERIRTAVSALAIPHANSPIGHVSVSIGVAVAYPHAGQSEGVLLRSADAALYDAKGSGRNRVSKAFLGSSILDGGLAEHDGADLVDAAGSTIPR